MFSNILSYELKQLYRNSWLGILTLVMIAFVGFAAYNGFGKVSQRTAGITEALDELHTKDSVLVDNLEKIARGEETGLARWMNPSDPSVVGFRHARLAHMDASPLAILATGQSDMYSHFVEASTYGNNYALDIAEISNPIQLLFGTFDMAFVFMFLVPLFIIAFTFNVLSKERELGTLRMIGAQPIHIARWLGQKLIVRYVLFAGISVLVFLLYLAIFSPQGFSKPLQIGLAVLQLLAYELFWFVLAGIVNLKVKSSSKNAMILIGLWLLIVLVIPVTANEIGSSLYPNPSRLIMLNEIRETNRSVEDKQDEILDSYLRDHPELASGDEEDYGFWHSYYATQDLLREEIEPLIASHEQALANRQGIINYMKYLSPAIIFQESFTKLAGSSTQDYENYKSQVMEYTDAWRAHIVPLLFNGENYKAETFEERPIFQYAPKNYNSRIFMNIVYTLLVALLLFFFGAVLGSKKNEAYH